MSAEFWAMAARLERAYHRIHNITGRTTITLPPDDTGNIQQHQGQGYAPGGSPPETRDSFQRFQTFGFASVPLPGTKQVALYHGGHRAFGTVVADEHPSYRPKNQQPGEFLNYIVDGAKQDGTQGTMRAILKGALGWIASLTGKTCNVGANDECITIVIGGKNTTTVTITGTSIKLAGNVEITGTLKVDGATTVQDISIGGTETGGGLA